MAQTVISMYATLQELEFQMVLQTGCMEAEVFRYTHDDELIVSQVDITNINRGHNIFIYESMMTLISIKKNALDLLISESKALTEQDATELNKIIDTLFERLDYIDNEIQEYVVSIGLMWDKA